MTFLKNKREYSEATFIILNMGIITFKSYRLLQFLEQWNVTPLDHLSAFFPDEKQDQKILQNFQCVLVLSGTMIRSIFCARKINFFRTIELRVGPSTQNMHFSGQFQTPPLPIKSYFNLLALGKATQGTPQTFESRKYSALSLEREFSSSANFSLMYCFTFLAEFVSLQHASSSFN